MPIVSPDIASVALYTPTPPLLRLYALPFLALYPLLSYAYHVRYDDWVKSQEWTFLYTVGLASLHSLAFLATKWSVRARAWITARPARSLKAASRVLISPIVHKGEGDFVPLDRTRLPDGALELSFTYQGDKYIYTTPDESAPRTAILHSPEIAEPLFRRLPYPVDSLPEMSHFQVNTGLKSDSDVLETFATYGRNVFQIPVPTFTKLFAEHAVAPFFVFQVFCNCLWLLDEYWTFPIFSLVMLVVFESTVVFGRLRTLNEFRTMTIQPFLIWVHRAGKWVEASTADLLPGDLVSVQRSSEDSGVPCDLLLCTGAAIVNEAMLSGESTPLLKESIELRDPKDVLDANGADRNSVLFGGTKILQTTEGAHTDSPQGKLKTPDGGALAVVLRTGFGTTQGGLVRLMVYTNEGRVGAGNWETFFFILFLLFFAICASSYVWIQGNAMGRPKGKLLLDCVMIITSVVPPELPMELSMAVNASLQALGKLNIFCTEPFRIPFAGKVDVCCFDKTGTITAEELQLQGVAQIGSDGQPVQQAASEVSRETMLTIVGAHALVLLDDGIVGDPMEKTTVDAVGWTLNPNDTLTPVAGEGKKAKASSSVQIKRRFQFSSALKRMSTISIVSEAAGKKGFAAVKGAPETLKGMYVDVPEGYDEVYKNFTRQGSRVLALGYKWLDTHSPSAINAFSRDEIESKLVFAGFLIFYSPLKPDAIASLTHLSDSSHRCIMITGDNPLTAIHVAEQVEIVDRDTLILDVREGATSEVDLVFRSVDEKLVIPVNPNEPLDELLFDKYDICMTGPAMRQFEEKVESWKILVENTWVYARVSPNQKELVLNTLRSIGYTTLMAGDGTNDVGALKAADVGVALLDGTEEDLEKIAEHARLERMKKVYESQVSLAARFKQPPPPVPPALLSKFPELEKAREEALLQLSVERRGNVASKFNFSSMQDKMAELEDGEGPPQIRLGDASVAAPFTSKLSNVGSLINIIRQGRSTLVAFTQMHKILALNCLTSAYSLSVLHLNGIKTGDKQSTISAMLLTACFFCVSRAQPTDRLSSERPLTRVFSAYIFLSVLLQFALHCGTTHFLVTQLVPQYEPKVPVDIEAKFTPSLLNTAIYLIGLSQQVNTFSVNFIGAPHRENLRQNKSMYYGMLVCFGVAFAGATELYPEMNEWLQLAPIPAQFQAYLVGLMAADFAGSYVIEWVIKAAVADQQPKKIITKRREKHDARRQQREAKLLAAAEAA